MSADPVAQKSPRPRWVRVAVAVSLAIGAVLLGVALYVYSLTTGSLAQLEGTATVPGLLAPVTIDRDELGIPTLSGRTRADVARALGFVHAQERFFQMDLLRRRSAGELAELFGSVAVDVPRSELVAGGIPSPETPQLTASFASGKQRSRGCRATCSRRC